MNFVPLKAKSFTYDPFFIQVVVTPGVVGARLYDPQKSAGETNQPPLAGDRIAPVTVNTAHLGLVLTREAKGLNDGDGIGVVFPLFRAVATDLNLSLAIALWAFIFVQFWSIQSMGALANFGRFFGFGPAAVVKGPIGVMVGLLEIISEVSRIISFTFRLFGNIFAGEIVLLMSAFLVPFVVATVFYGLEVFVGFIQAFVFAMLTLVFAVTARVPRLARRTGGARRRGGRPLTGGRTTRKDFCGPWAAGGGTNDGSSARDWGCRLQ